MAVRNNSGKLQVGMLPAAALHAVFETFEEDAGGPDVYHVLSSLAGAISAETKSETLAFAVKAAQRLINSYSSPGTAIESVAEVLEFGAKKYDKNNWRTQTSESDHFKYSVILDSAVRHLLRRTVGQHFDSESGLLHVSHALCNILFFIEYLVQGYGTDDRFLKKDAFPEQAELKKKSVFTTEVDLSKAKVGDVVEFKDGEIAKVRRIRARPGGGTDFLLELDKKVRGFRNKDTSWIYLQNGSWLGSPKANHIVKIKYNG